MVSPLTPVPVIVGVLSFVGEIGATVVGATDAVWSILIFSVLDAKLRLPIVSVSKLADMFTESVEGSIGDAT